MQTGIGLIESERMRQVLHEGFTSTHDDQHTEGELALAGASYALGAVDQEHGVIRPEAPTWWEFSPDWWKPDVDPIRNLAKAGALIAAEIDRLLRLQGS